MIVSSIDGRVRVRNTMLQHPEAAAAVKKGLASIEGISDVSINHRVGSMLIIYDPCAADIKKITDTISGYMNVKDGKKTVRTNRDKRGLPFAITRKRAKLLVNAGMAASLLISLAGIALKLKKLHAIAGLLFVGLLGIHITL